MDLADRYGTNESMIAIITKKEPTKEMIKLFNLVDKEKQHDQEKQLT